MPTYRIADDEDHQLLGEVMTAHHQRLADAGVRVGLLYALAPRDEKTGMPKGNALKLHGYAAMAIVRINSLKDRVEGKPDATIVLDYDAWPAHTHERKLAILDHELAHLLLVSDEETGIALDDACRPKLKMRPHDIQMGAFLDVVERHKQHSAEADQFLEAHKAFLQLCFPWG